MRSIHEKKSGNSPIERESLEAFVEPWFFHAMCHTKKKVGIVRYMYLSCTGACSEDESFCEGCCDF